MKFACPKCDTRYAVSDDKLPPAQAVRFPCKRCGQVIRLRRKPTPVVENPVNRPSVPDFARLGGEPTRVAAPDRLRSLQIASRQPQAIGDENAGATRIATLDEIRAQQDASFRARDTDDAHADSEWHVLIAGKQSGPWPIEHVRSLVRNREIDASNYVWRDGMANWERFGQVAALRSLLTEKHEPGVIPVPTAVMGAQQLHEQLARVRTAPDEPSFDSGVFLGMPTGDGLSRADIDDHETLNEALAPLSDEPFSSPGSPFQGSPPAATAPESTGAREAYVNAPPGDATRVFMATAGIFRRRQQQRIVGTAIALALGALATTIGLDLAGVITIPGMGMVYDVTGMNDPNIDRARERVDKKLQAGDIAPEERARLQALRNKLVGGGPSRPASSPAASKVATAAPAAVTTGIDDKPTLSEQQRNLALDVFSDARKRESGIKLSTPESIQAPNLPAGLTQEAIYQVISDSSRAMSLCYAEAMRKGEKLSGKMEIQLTIEATGQVTDAQVQSPQFRATQMALCTVRRVKTWRFPRFNGEPVTVIYPYILEAGM